MRAGAWHAVARYVATRKPLPRLEVYRASLPALLILAIGVIGITYVAWLTTSLGSILGDG